MSIGEYPQRRLKAYSFVHPLQPAVPLPDKISPPRLVLTPASQIGDAPAKAGLQRDGGSLLLLDRPEGFPTGLEFLRQAGPRLVRCLDVCPHPRDLAGESLQVVDLGECERQRRDPTRGFPDGGSVAGDLREIDLQLGHLCPGRLQLFGGCGGATASS